MFLVPDIRTLISQVPLSFKALQGDQMPAPSPTHLVKGLLNCKYALPASQQDDQQGNPVSWGYKAYDQTSFHTSFIQLCTVLTLKLKHLCWNKNITDSGHSELKAAVLIYNGCFHFSNEPLMAFRSLAPS